MAGDPTKVDFWSKGDVWVTENLDAAIPATENDPFGPEWHLVGILNGEDGFTDADEEETTDHYGWDDFIGTRYANFKTTRTFTALENNEVTRKMLWPGSGPGEIKAPDRSKRWKVAFENREGAKVRRLITAFQAQIAANGERTTNKTDPTGLPFIVTPIPDPVTGRIYIERPAGPVLESLTVSGGASVDEGGIIRLSAEAAYSDSSTRDVTSSAVWVSGDPDVATVEFGFVTGVSAGTVEVTAMFGDQSDSHTVEVTA